jgi:rubrerythrin
VKKITSKTELLESLKDVRAVEIMARKGYEEDAITFQNFEIINTITKIKQDEDVHIKLLDELIRMLSSL